MELLMLFSLSLSKFTSSTAAPALLGLNWTLALASCLGPTSPILPETHARGDASLSRETRASGATVNNSVPVRDGFAPREADPLDGEAAVVQQLW